MTASDPLSGASPVRALALVAAGHVILGVAGVAVWSVDRAVLALSG
ncbi:MAG: hypothetical protein ACTHVY_07250 [Brevibacterium yomogidense]